MSEAKDIDLRAVQLSALQRDITWDLVVIGGGATGLGVALDAATRGFKVACLEAGDFAGGTSSRATKLVHGGVRYLAQGNVALVREALHERSTLLANAPHLAQPLPFVVPSYQWWEGPFYGAGLKMYDALAGRRGLGDTEWLGARRTRDLLPNVRQAGLRGGVRYWDGQFDDARLAVTLARTAQREGATVINHCPVRELLRESGSDGAKVRGVRCEDAETGTRYTLRAQCVVNATGVWVDGVRDMDRDADAPARAPMVAPSQGTHLVVDRSFLGSQHAIMVPKTADGRVLFVVPWLGRVILGTTDTPREDIPREPTAFAADIDFILGEAERYLERAPLKSDIKSIWVGLRPLVRAGGDDDGDTAGLSREHVVRVGRSGLVTVTGGKWTTYRAMAEDVLSRCMDRRLLPRRPGGATEKLPLVGAAAGRPLAESPGAHSYGAEAGKLARMPGQDRWFWRDGGGGLNEAMVRWAVRHEMARSVEDVLARRSRLLFLDAKMAEGVAEDVARVVADERGCAPDAVGLEAFKALARQYRTVPKA